MQVLDSGLSNLSATIGSVMSAGTQTVVGWDQKDTALFIARDEIVNSYTKTDWEGVGKGVLLGVSQILKYEAPAATLEVSPV